MKKILIATAAVLLPLAGYAAYMHLTWRSRTEAKGNRIIERIEAFKTQHGHYPDDLGQLGIPQKDEGNSYEGETFYYDCMHDGTYQLYFSTGPDESYVYHSLLRAWMDDFYTDLVHEQKVAVYRHIEDCYTQGLIDSTVYDHAKPNLKRLRPEGSGSIPDSLVHASDYYQDGRLAGEGWILFYDDPQSDTADRTGVWTFFSETGVAVEVNFGNGQSSGTPIRE
ncbi:hypothetical protein [Prevotella sp. KH2C16]|uniref:hypothetical protein n=1 Tax=Prevotella sp. KH2C16 TaxID=1855325 RepID=UPI0008E47914|nr:hypothetical protein [Prevotella sp. KH2C16]SFG26608.1 hypothetical protein SAMN05216383_10881 [Prevotella sp. KH2C16]